MNALCGLRANKSTPNNINRILITLVQQDEERKKAANPSHDHLKCAAFTERALLQHRCGLQRLAASLSAALTTIADHRWRHYSQIIVTIDGTFSAIKIRAYRVATAAAWPAPG